jgi:hypothetical protein
VCLYHNPQVRNTRMSDYQTSYSMDSGLDTRQENLKLSVLHFQTASWHAQTPTHAYRGGFPWEMAAEILSAEVSNA